ncbi:MAG: hypothetical protein D6760_00240 [Deltaproteobacteria bacterium]|nr:MAG: hypothetical protein D6760_00240 [Deltaproteobacteria bacterium]
MTERTYRVDGRLVRVRLSSGEHSGALLVDDRRCELADFEVGGRYVVFTLDGRRYRLPFVRSGGRIHVGAGGHDFDFSPADDDASADEGAGGFTPEVVAPMPGKVLDVLVAEGDTVREGQPLLLIEAMKMEQTLRAGADAVVRSVHAEPGAMVGPGQVLVVLEQPETDRD